MPIPTDFTALAPADFTAIIAAEDVIRQKLAPNQCNIPPADTRNHQNMGYDSSEFGDIVYTIADQHSITIPSDLDFVKIKKIYQLRSDLLKIKNNKSDVDKLVDSIVMATGIVLMRYFNRIYSNASEIAAKGDYPFSELVREAGKRYEKGPRSQGTATKVPAGTEVTINKVIPGELFINDGATVLKFTCSNELTGKLLSAETVTVNPGNSTPVPKGYTTIVVLNVSADTTGSFIVKLKK